MSQAPLMVSVSGLRGWIGQSLTPSVAAEFATCFGHWLGSHRAPSTSAASGGGGDAEGFSPGSRAPHVVIGRDSRPSGSMVESAAVAGLLAAGCRVTRLGLATTPGVAIMTTHLRADGGMVVTASHNPIQWNGLKCLRYDGVAPPIDQARQIIESFHKRALVYAPVEQLQTAVSNAQTDQVHLDRLLPHIDVAAIQRRKLRVVLDSVCGAGGPSTAKLLAALGVELIHLHAEPTGLFPHPPEPTRDHLTGLAAAVREHHADLGLAQDPDADRLAIVDEQGQYLGEEYTLALAALHILARLGGDAKGKHLAANLSTSRMIDDVAQRAGAVVDRTPVGEANVAAALRRPEAVLGGEGNGGVIWPVVGLVRDSLTGIALACEMVAQRGKPLSAICRDIPAYAMVKDKTDVRPDVVQRLETTLRQAFPQAKVDTQDGVRLDWPDRWVHVRASNTEPILRLISEARAEAAARQLISDTRATLGL